MKRTNFTKLISGFFLMLSMLWHLDLRAQDPEYLIVEGVNRVGETGISLLIFENAAELASYYEAGDQVQFDLTLSHTPDDRYFRSGSEQTGTEGGSPDPGCIFDVLVVSSSSPAETTELVDINGTIFDIVTFFDGGRQGIAIVIIDEELSDRLSGEFWTSIPDGTYIESPASPSISDVKSYLCANNLNAIQRNIESVFVSGRFLNPICGSPFFTMDCSSGMVTLKLASGGVWSDGTTTLRKQLSLGESISMNIPTGPCADTYTYTYTEADRVALFRQCASCIDSYTTLCTEQPD